MAAIKPLADIASKFAEVTPGRSAYYEKGVTSPSKDWETETAKSESAYEGGVTSAISRKAFGKGVRKAGTGKWKAKASTLGVSRWGPGVSAATDDYQSGFSAYHDVIAKTTLSPRYPVGDPRNYKRVTDIGDPLHKKKIGL